MDPKAIVKARQRLQLATDKLREAENASNYDSFSGAWYFFLIAAKNVYTTLEQGSKVSAQSRQWFGGKKNERKSDPLLQYLFQARDDDEHGLEDVTTHHPGMTAFGVAAPGFSRAVSIKASTDAAGKLTVHKLESRDQKPILIHHIPPHAVLKPVIGRGNIAYNPPTTHMGAALPDSLPITVGKAARAYLETLVSDAAARAA
jgi:hypothetical protein